MPRLEHERHYSLGDLAQDVEALQTNQDVFLERLYETCPYLDGRLIEDQALDYSTYNDIDHKLGRKLRGWFVVKDDAPPSGGRAYRSAAQSLVDATNDQVEIDTVDYDRNDDFDTSTNHGFLCPVDGLYHCTAGVTFSPGLADGESAHVMIFRNASADVRGTWSVQGAASQAENMATGIIKASKGDYIYVYGYYNGATGTEAIGGNHRSRNYLEVRLMRDITDGQSETTATSTKPAVDVTKTLRLYSECDRTVSLWVF